MSNHPNRGKIRTAASTPTPEEVKAAREAAGLTQKAAAAVINVSVRAWEDWEGGRRTCHPAFLELFRIKTKT